MKVACLISGGKDSMLALHKASEKYKIATLVSIFSKNRDSYMFHTTNVSLVDGIALSLELPLFKAIVSGEEEKEVEELSDQLSVLDVDGIVIGGVKSNYQKKRFQRIAEKMGVELISPLWGMNENQLLKEVSEKFNAVIVKTSAMGLDESYLGRRIDYELLCSLKELNLRYGINLSGEGGEYETLVLDAPLYKKRIEILETEIERNGLSFELKVKGFKLVDK